MTPATQPGIPPGAIELETTPPPREPIKRHPRLVRTAVILGVIAVVLVCLLLAAVLWARGHMEPLVRDRVVQTLEDRLHEPVELDHIGVSVVTGTVQVTGTGLRVTSDSGKPLVSVNAFDFSTGLRDLFSKHSSVVKVHVQGLRIEIPAGPERQRAAAPLRSSFANPRPGIFSVAEVIATDATLSVDRLDPAKQPLVFQISKLRFSQSMPGMPFVYEADLVNPKPVGDIHSTGRFGPWNSDVPRNTPIDGSYTFLNADLSTIHGIRGHLAGRGDLSGTLGEIASNGTVDVPDFGVDPGTNNVHLTANYHATVDGTNGDTILAPVDAHFLHTDVIASGRIVRVPSAPGEIHHGHDILLDTTIRGRVEDILDLVSKGRAPLLRANFSDRGRLHIPPGKERVIMRLQTSGTATLSGILWTDPETQQKVDSLSMRAVGKADEMADDPHHRAPVVTSSIETHFKLDRGDLHLDGLSYTMPGATVQMDGSYDLVNEALDFHGHVRTKATASQMITGWKSLLLKPFDPLFKKNGAGLQLPIELTGTREKPHVGLDLLHHK